MVIYAEATPASSECRGTREQSCEAHDEMKKETSVNVARSVKERIREHVIW